jgi:hypothetical protein
MKLFSVRGRHSAETKNPIQLPKLDFSFLREGDEWLIAGVLVFAVATSCWVLRDIPEKEVQTSEPIPVVAAAVPVEEMVEVVSVDQTEALAMGIDAVISSECKSEWVSDTTLLMVANVIVNRTADTRFPDTVDQVLCQPYQFSCFSATGMKWVGKAADDYAFRARCLSAAEAAMNGERLLNYGVVYVSGSKQGAVEAQLDGLYFCR